MKIKYLIALIWILIYSSNISVSPILATDNEFNYSAKIYVETNLKEYEEKQKKIRTLENFLNIQNSPLTPYVSTIVDEAEKNELDYRLIPAISGVESSFGKAIPQNSYNAYGWNNGDYYFKSWEEGIMTVSETLNNKYKKIWGCETIYDIGHYYASSPTWANRVVSIMDRIENTSYSVSFLPLDL